MDWLLEVRAAEGDEVDLQAVVEFLMWLRNERGVHIGAASYDRFQSRHSVQVLKRQEIDVEFLSLKQEHYDAVRGLLGIVVMYFYKPFYTEITSMVKGKERPNHPIRTGKPDDEDAFHDDVADGWTGTVFQAAKHSGILLHK